MAYAYHAPRPMSSRYTHPITRRKIPSFSALRTDTTQTTTAGCWSGAQGGSRWSATKVSF